MLKKRIFSQKPNCSHIINIKFFIKTPSINAHIWSKHVNSVKNPHYGPKKSIGCPFLPFFHENYCLMPIYIFKKKNVRSLKTHYSHDHFVEKTYILSELRNIVLLCQLKKNMKNPLLSCPWSKNVNSVKTTLYYEPKKSVWRPFFPIYHEKIIALMCEKTSNL